MSRHGRFVDARVIRDRMDRKDARLARELEAFRTRTQPGTGYSGVRLNAPKVPVVVEPAIVPVSLGTPGPVVDVTLEPLPGPAPIPEDFDPCADYSPRGRFGRRLDGRPVRLGGLQGPPPATCADCGVLLTRLDVGPLCQICAGKRDAHTSDLERRLTDVALTQLKAALPVRAKKEIA